LAASRVPVIGPLSASRSALDHSHIARIVILIG
jgi:hypothetical protein